MTVKEFLQLILKRIQVIILIGLTCAIIAGVVSFVFIKPIYESTSSFYVLSTDLNKDTVVYSELQASQMLVNDCREFIKSRTVLDQVRQDLAAANMSASGLASKITVQSKSDTRIIEIRVRDIDPQIAYAINSFLSDKLLLSASTILRIDNIAVVDRPNLPTNPVSPGTIYYVVIGALLGVALAVFIVFTVDYFDTTIKNAEDVEKYLHLPVIGKIPYAETRTK